MDLDTTEGRDAVVDLPKIDSETTESEPLPHDSMVTVRLSEPPPALTVDTGANILGKQNKGAVGSAMTPGMSIDEREREEDILEESPRITMVDPNGEVLSPTGSESADSHDESRRGSDSSEASIEGGGVNWEELEKTEEKEPRNESSDDVGTPLLSSPPCFSQL